MKNEDINLEEIQFTKLQKILNIPYLKYKISTFLYSYEYSIKNNQLELIKDNEYMNIGNINNKLLILAEKCGNKEIIKYLYSKKFIEKGIVIYEEWYELYFQNIDNGWELYKLYSILKTQIVDRPDCDSEIWYDVSVKYIGMGLFCVMSLLKKENKCFFRISGGSTGYDFKEYIELFKDFDPNDTSKIFNINDGIQMMYLPPVDLYNFIQKIEFSLWWL
jgi:hypothetical protein